MNVITVSAVPGGWVVDHAPARTPLMFLAGGKAEQKARELAQRACRRGLAAEVQIYDLAGRLAGRFRYGGEAASA
jgi:hypothetical protein